MTSELTPSELKPIIDAWGGPEKFAAMLEVGPRIVYYWLAGKKRISKPMSRLIRMLTPPVAESIGAPEGHPTLTEDL